MNTEQLSEFVPRAATACATATPLKVGRTTIVVETEMRDGDGRLVAKTTQAQAV